MTLIAKVLTDGPVTSEAELADSIRFGTLLTDDESLRSSSVAHRWRGICLRQTAVLAWRDLWHQLSVRAHEAGSFLPISDLQDWLAEWAPNQNVGTFLDALPSTMDGNQTLAAERQIADLNSPMLALAHILLSGRRASELEGNAQWGYLGEPQNTSERSQELTPLWVQHTTDRWRDRPMRDFCSFLVKLLLDRSQRVALDKAGYRGGRYVLPARVLLRDGFVEWRDREGVGEPPLRLERIVHIGRQVGLFDTDDEGNWSIGNRGDLIAN